jgi:xylan 1,4-beta-xylosidase
MSDPTPRVSRRQVVLGATAATALAGGALGATPASASTGSGPRATVDLNGGQTAYPHLWEKVIAGDWAKQVLRSDYQKQLLQTRDDLGVRSLRFHGIFNDSMSTYTPTYLGGRARNAAFSNDAYGWFNVDSVYDALVDHRMRPFVELSSMPSVLQAGTPPFQPLFYDFNQMEPKDYTAWGKFVGDFARHLVDRYGLAEVRTWPFEVWNEPNLFAFYNGDQQSYFRLYRAAAEAIKNVDTSLRVGGPATSAGQSNFGAIRSPGIIYYREFMQWATANKVPVDFGSAHGYGSDVGVGPEGVASFFRQNRADTPAKLPLYITETNYTTTLGDIRLDTSPAAASIVRTTKESIGVVDALGQWAFSDIMEEQTQPDRPFHGGWGLQTIHGIKKPAYRMLEILHRVGDRRLELALTGAPNTVSGLAVTGRNGRDLDIILTNHALHTGVKDVEVPAGPCTLTVTVQGLRPSARAHVKLIDDDHTNPRRAWKEMGSPEYLTRRQIDQLEDASEIDERILRLNRLDSRRTTFTITLPPEGVAAVHIVNA